MEAHKPRNSDSPEKLEEAKKGFPYGTSRLKKNSPATYTFILFTFCILISKTLKQQ
jgi:hypothetical protein